ncbi:FHA domain-containing protein [Massilia sp. CCM 8733]|uniref:FHA domain-containing protein n=1 Tax=Massilia mucilaginosa TaxID=2609282 RepID=A0ABX0P328_9BURK|nr:FHA domain-containing protein [Massilia mucilaginosa]NHZ93146.1 FHA domain-containing protein [Massilia mucilaginosa]
MAKLQGQHTQERLHLRSLHLFGRNRNRVDTPVDGADASQIHASIRWDGSSWLLCDHSRNGTYINGQAIGAHARHVLAPGDTIRFASAASQWRVLDLDPPLPLLLPSDPAQPPIALTGLHLLPDQHVPEAAVYQDQHGQWLHEDADGCHLLNDGDTLCVNQQIWHYVAAMLIEATAPLAALRDTRGGAIKFTFIVSQNEEHVQLRVALGPSLVDLGERSHHYGLLILARQRVFDAQRGFDRYSQGWLGAGQLADMLRIDPKHLNMQLHRARHQISEAVSGNPTLVNFIERRRGELRFGNFAFEIRLGARSEAVFDPGRTHAEPAAHARAAP